MRRKDIPLIILISAVIILGVNIAGNYRYYAAGNDWRYSIFFVLAVGTLGWLFGIPLGMAVGKLFRGKQKPGVKLLLAMSLMVLHGTIIMLVAMKSMVFFLHFAEFSTQQYVDNISYAVLISLIIGLSASGQQFLISLKKSAEDQEKMKQEMIRSQYEALKSQVNPHFLFNSLNTLTVMIPRQPELAVKFVEQMSKVFRYSLQNSSENTIEVTTELKVVRSFLFLNEQRFEGKLIIEIDVDDSAMQRHIITQSLLMLAENAVKHNEISIAKPLTIKIYAEDKYLVMANTLQPKTQIEQSTKVGLENIGKRYELASDVPVVVEQTNDLFIVKLPLL